MFETVAPFLQEKRYGDAEAALKSYLRYHGKQAEPWMYEWLIKTIEARKHSDSEIRTAVGFAGLLAKRTRNPNDLIRLADMMVIRNLYGPVGDAGYETNIGELVDMATEKVPADMRPPMMSVNLALKTRDPERMARAAEQLLALGWLGFDDKLRKDLKEQVEALEKSLREDGKSDLADTLARRAGESEVRDIYVGLKWSGEADIDLAVEEPLGATARYQTPRTVFGGALIKNGYGKHPEEVYVCPRGFDGDYTVRVVTVYNEEDKPVKEAIMTVITHEGGTDEKRREIKVDLEKPAPVVVHLTGGRRKEVLPFIAQPDPPSLVTKAPKAAQAGERAKPAVETLNDKAGAPRPR